MAYALGFWRLDVAPPTGGHEFDAPLAVGILDMNVSRGGKDEGYNSCGDDDSHDVPGRHHFTGNFHKDFFHGGHGTSPNGVEIAKPF